MFDLVHSLIASLSAVTTPALAIVLFTVAVRLLISPLTYWQVRGERHRAATLAPQLKELQEKHKDDPRALATESLALQGQMLRGLLPTLAQAPFFFLMYRAATDGHLSGALAGVPLTAHIGAGLPVFAVLLAIAAALAFWSSRRTTAPIVRYLPFLTVPVVAWLPLAGALYLVTSTAWTALETAVWRRPRPVTDR